MKTKISSVLSHPLFSTFGAQITLIDQLSSSNVKRLVYQGRVVDKTAHI